MPNVSPTTSLLGRHFQRLLTFCLAIAVSYLFSVLPFGNPRVGYLPPLPAPAPHLAPASEGLRLTDPLSWQSTCQELWATVKDLAPFPLVWGPGGAPLPSLGPEAVGPVRLERRDLLLRIGRRFSRLRAPPPLA